MSVPTDPLPEGLYWHNYVYQNWGARRIEKKEDEHEYYAAWTFNPRLCGFDWPCKESKDASPDLWIVRGVGATDNEYSAAFPTLEEATRYISVRAMLGTWGVEK